MLIEKAHRDRGTELCCTGSLCEPDLARHPLLDTTVFEVDNLHWQIVLQGLQMRNALAFATAIAFTATAVAFSRPALAHERWPDIPDEIGVGSPAERILIPFRCSDGPVRNFYHGAYYDQPPAIFLSNAYRPYYRYTAYRVLPRTYFCSDRYRY